MLKKKHVLIGLSTVTLLNMLAFNSHSIRAEELDVPNNSGVPTLSSPSSENIPESSSTNEQVLPDLSVKERTSEEKNTEERISTSESTTNPSTTVPSVEDTASSTDKNVSRSSQSASFNLSDWQYSEDANTITLNKYTGTNMSITIPGEINGKQVAISSISVIPTQTVTDLTFEAVNNKKVKINNVSIGSAFGDHNYNGTPIGANKVLTRVDFSGLDMNNIQNMLNTFYGCTALKTVNFGDNTLASMRDFGGAFFNCYNLVSVEGKITFSPNLTSLSQTFASCYNLKNIDTSSWDVSNVRDMSQLFWGSNLETLDVSSWNVSNVDDMFEMFKQSKVLCKLDMTSWHIKANTDMTDMFWSSTYSPLFILTNDDRLLNHNYVNDRRLPYGPNFKTAGGTFGSNVLVYHNNDFEYTGFFLSPAMRPSDTRIQNSSFKQELSNFMKNAIPNRTDYAFTDWSLTAGTPVENAQTIQELFNTTYTAQWVSDKYNTSVDNTILTPSSSLGLAYMPTKFTIDPTPMNNSGAQEIPLLKNESFNLGVKDRTRTNTPWTVTAQLKWNSPLMANAYIQTYNTGGSVNQNISTGTTSVYDPAIDLIPNTDGITGSADYKITTDVTTPLLSSRSSTNKNGVFDYNLGNAILVIPETENIKVDTYTGQVTWNLVSAP